jgi:transcriptional regulator with XRE-family HTH domain
MVNIREVFARNLRENRRKSGLTQANLAEKSNVSTHYVALIEMARNLPKVEVIERFANILNIEIYELFLEPHSNTPDINKMHQTMIEDLKDIVKAAVTEAFEKERKKAKKTRKKS